MFGIGMPEFILIAVVALIVFGPKKLPELAKSMGKAVREFKKATSELKETMQVDGDLAEVKQAFTELHSEVGKTIRQEADRPESPPAGAPAAPVPAAAPAAAAAPPVPPVDTAAEPSSEAKLAELKKAFDAWTAAKPAAAPEGGEPAPPAGSNPPETGKPA